MKWPRKIRSKFGAWFAGARLDAEMDAEMRAHLEFRTEKNLAAGMSPEEAHYAALRSFGGVDQLKEKVRAQRGGVWLGHLVRDAAYGTRMLRKSPGFTATAVLTLALGIAACTAVFSVVHTTVLRPFSYPRPDRLVMVRELNPSNNYRAGVSPADFFDYQPQVSSFAKFAAAYYWTHNLIVKGADPVRAHSEQVTADFFSTLGVHPMLGRDFRPEEMALGKGDVAILSHRLWLSEFGANPGVIGETIIMDDRPTTIIGVMPADFQADFPDPAIYAPFNMLPTERLIRDWHYVVFIGRLKEGVSVAQADTELRLMGEWLSKQYPVTNAGWVTTAVSLVDDTVAYARPLLFTLLGAVGALLLIACVNIANLLLARATTRQKEVVVRTALGATRGQIVRQFLCESLLLAGLGGTLGVMIAEWGVKLVIEIAPVDLPRLAEMRVDGHALAFSCALVLVTGFGFGLFPAFQISRVNLNEVLKDGGRGTSAGRTGMRLRNLLVMGEVALALLLLFSAGLLIRSFQQYQKIDYGYTRQGLYYTPVLLSQRKYPESHGWINFVDQALGRLNRLPGISGVSLTSRYLTDGGGADFVIAGQPAPPSNALPNAFGTSVSPDYFRTLNIPLLRGRFFNLQDAAGKAPVMIINEDLARHYFPNADPIGQRIKIPLGNAYEHGKVHKPSDPPIWREIVGVIGSIKDQTITPGTPIIRPQLYLPFDQAPYGSLNLYVRPAAGKALDIHAVCEAVHAVDKDVAISMLWEQNDTGSGLVGLRRFSMDLSIVFSSVALLLAAVGIYGVKAFNVAQRTSEIGIRMALGAQPKDVIKLVLLSAGRMVIFGLLIGIATALATARLFGSMLYNLSAYDPMTLCTITGVLAAVGFLACWIPARRATKVDPLVALRAE